MSGWPFTESDALDAARERDEADHAHDLALDARDRIAEQADGCSECAGEGFVEYAGPTPFADRREPCPVCAPAPAVETNRSGAVEASDFLHLALVRCPDCHVRPVQVRLLTGGQAAVCLPCAHAAIEGENAA